MKFSAGLPPRSRPPGGPAFTLMEVLVAMAVLLLLVVLVAGIVQSGNLLITGNRKNLNADATAREIFSRFSQDINQMAIRPDLDVLISSNNHVLFFFSEAPGFHAGNNPAEFNSLTLVGYRINTQAQLERLGKGMTWTNLPYLTYSTNAPAPESTPLAASTIAGAWPSTVGSAPAYSDGVDDDYHPLSDGVFGMFYCFQKTDGTYALTPPGNAQIGRLAGVNAIVLTLAILDGDTRKIINDTTQLITSLPIPTQADLDNQRLPADLWQEAVNHSAAYAQAAGIPAAAAARVRIYQRTFPLPKP